MYRIKSWLFWRVLWMSPSWLTLALANISVDSLLLPKYVLKHKQMQNEMNRNVRDILPQVKDPHQAWKKTSFWIPNCVCVFLPWHINGNAKLCMWLLSMLCVLVHGRHISRFKQQLLHFLMRCAVAWTRVWLTSLLSHSDSSAPRYWESARPPDLSLLETKQSRSRSASRLSLWKTSFIESGGDLLSKFCQSFFFFLFYAYLRQIIVSNKFKFKKTTGKYPCWCRRCRLLILIGCKALKGLVW